MVKGGRGADRLWGGRGLDDVRPGPAADVLRLGPGADYVALGDDGQVDRVLCGGGDDYIDRSSVDPLDVYVDCETVAGP